VPVAQETPAFVTFVARVRGDAERYLPILRDAVRQVDREVPIYSVETLDRRLRESLAKPRFYTTAVEFFGVLALLLAVIGVYGVAAHSIAQRMHEIGVRVAMGATPGEVRFMLLRQSLAPVVLGLAAGVAGAGVGTIVESPD